MAPWSSSPPGSTDPEPSTFGSGANTHSGNKHEIVTERRFCFYLGQKLGSPHETYGSSWSPWSPPLVPPALSLQHLVAAPTITQETSTKLPLSGPKIGKANSHLFTNGSPWSPWPPGPLAPLVPPALSLQHLVAVPTLSQETSTKLSPSGPKIEKANSPLFTNGSPMVPMAPWSSSPPLVPPALSLQHLVAAPTLTQETSTKLSLVMRWPFVKQPALVCARAHFYPN